MALRKDDLQALAQAKLDDAGLLLVHRRASNAYYLAGYAVELALKACIANQISENTIPDRDFVKNIYSHQFPQLIGLAGLSTELKSALSDNPNFAANWAISSEWLPEARYRSYTSFEAQMLIEAIADSDDGVLQWIKHFW